MVQWGPINDQKILLALIPQIQGKIDYVAIATAIGEGCTERAVVERVKALKQMAKSGDGSGTSSAPVTPKRKRGIKDLNSLESPTKKSVQQKKEEQENS